MKQSEKDSRIGGSTRMVHQKGTTPLLTMGNLVVRF